MASQICEHCDSIVAPDEQFCPNCGSFIDPMRSPRPRARRAASSGNVISVSSDGPADGPYEEFSLDEEPPAPESHPVTEEQATTTPGREVACPSCGAANPANNRHCQECGARLRQGPLPTAPRPAVQATAGVRAALAISGLLLGVILIALFYNIFTGDPAAAPESTTTTSSTIPPIANPEPIDVLDQTCTPPGIGGLICANLTSGATGQGNEYQVSWEEEVGPEGVQILLTFVQPISINEIHWVNIEDPTRFRQNYRASALEIVSQDSVTEVPVSLLDQPGTQVVRYSALNTTTLEIRVIDVFQAEVLDDNRFDELAIDEIIVVGRPVTPSATPTTVPGSTTTTTS